MNTPQLDELFSRMKQASTPASEVLANRTQADVARTGAAASANNTAAKSKASMTKLLETLGKGKTRNLAGGGMAKTTPVKSASGGAGLMDFANNMSGQISTGPFANTIGLPKKPAATIDPKAVGKSMVAGAAPVARKPAAGKPNVAANGKPPMKKSSNQHFMNDTQNTHLAFGLIKLSAAKQPMRLPSVIANPLKAMNKGVESVAPAALKGIQKAQPAIDTFQDAQKRTPGVVPFGNKKKSAPKPVAPKPEPPLKKSSSFNTQLAFGLMGLNKEASGLIRNIASGGAKAFRSVDDIPLPRRLPHPSKLTQPAGPVTPKPLTPPPAGSTPASRASAPTQLEPPPSEIGLGTTTWNTPTYAPGTRVMTMPPMGATTQVQFAPPKPIPYNHWEIPGETTRVTNPQAMGTTGPTQVIRNIAPSPQAGSGVRKLPGGMTPMQASLGALGVGAALPMAAYAPENAPAFPTYEDRTQSYIHNRHPENTYGSQNPLSIGK